MVAAGHLLILNTMRSGEGLQVAVDWFKKNNIPLHGVNEDPGQRGWTQSQKVYAHIYIDDAALGCPLVHPGNGNRPYVDWKEVERMLFLKECINPAPDPIMEKE